MVKKIELDTISFPNQKQALSFFKEMLSRYKHKELVNSEDTRHLNALLKKHSDYADKVGRGVSHFEVMLAEFNTKCFRIVRKDKTEIDFSYIHCIKEC